MAVKLTHPLKVERKRRNMSQRMLADFAGLGLSTIVRAEQGQQVSADARRRICEFLGKTSEELGLFREESQDFSEIATESIEDPISGEGDSVNRREALKHIGIAGAAAILGTRKLFDEEPWERLSRAISKPASIDSATIAQLESMTKSYWSLRANIPSHDLISGVHGHLETVTSMLHNAGAAAPQLYSIAGETALIAGQLAFDVNNHNAARGYYKASAEAAAEGDNSTLQAVAFARSSFVYIERSEPANALVLLDKAANLANTGGNPLVEAWIHAIEAEAYANNQEEAKSLRALSKADDAVSDSSETSDTYATGFNASRLASYKGICYSRLNRPEKALDAFKQALELMNPTAMRRRSRVLADIATTYGQQGEVEEACRLASQALALIQQTHNVMALPRLQRFRRTVDRWHLTPAVRAFDEQLLLA